MGEATLYGLGASSALLVGALMGTLWRPRPGVVAAALAFASGALAAAVSVELFSDAYEKTGALVGSPCLRAIASRPIRRYREGILAVIRLGLSNGPL